MVKLHNKFHNKGLEIISISLDGTPNQTSPKEDWEKAVSNDELTWTQLSDLKGWDSKIRYSYNIKSIPHTILIDENGLIIGENFSHEVLDSKISEILNL